MIDRPILFSAPMVRALIEGRKTQTRRICRQANDACLTHVVQIDVPNKPGWFGDEEGDVLFFSGYAPGDRLWVREAYRVHRAYDDLKPSELGGDQHVWPELDRDNCDAHGRYRHGRFMPRWASRLTLTGRGRTQFVHPYFFGEPFFKNTGLELVNLPALRPTNMLVPPRPGTDEHKAWSRCHREPPGPDRARRRSETYPSIAAAMADQWGALLPDPQMDLFGAAA